MSMMIFTVTPDEGEQIEVVAGSRDLSRWEGLGRMDNGQPRSMATLQQNLTMDEMYRICWIAMERQAAGGRLELPAGVTDWVTLKDRADIMAKPTGDVAALAAQMAAAGGAYPPVR